MLILQILFWTALIIVVYTYIGYGAVLFVLVKIKRLLHKKNNRTAATDEQLPPITLMICAYNESDIVKEKMANTMQLNYPEDKLHVIWVTDGSTDDTNEKLSFYPQVTTVFTPERKGKTAALNHGITAVKTPIVVFTDANTMLNDNALRIIAQQFNNPKVGCVSGEKRVAAHKEDETASHGEGAYWRYESKLKQWDYELNSTMGAAGELFAIRTALYEEMPNDTLLDDFIMSMRIVQRGYIIAYTPDAYAMEYGSANMTEESKRKRRIAAGGLQSIIRLRPLLNPINHPLTTFQYVSHRVLRWSITPVALLSLVPLNVLLVLMNGGTIYTMIWLLQIIFYMSATAGYLYDMRGKRNKLFYIPYYFVFMNINVFRGINYLRSHSNNGAWEKAKRS